ncbi:MAG: BLUF domain-containing protein [Verrucomicrobiota bacterium]
MSFIQLVYVSAATKPFSLIELRELLSKARKNNTSVGVTGLLLYHQNSTILK